MAFPNANLPSRHLLISLALAAFGVLLAGWTSVLAPADKHEQATAACSTAQDEAYEAQNVEPLSPAQQRLVRHLSRRFQIAPESTEQMVDVAYRAGRQMGLDPLLVLAVIAVESRFNPIAESRVGAKGLMQIIPKYHEDKLLKQGGDEAVLDPASNILVGTQILREYVRSTGTVEAGLQFYNGALWDADARYAQRVLAERNRLERVANPRARGA